MADSAAIPLVGRSIELDRIRAATERAAAAAGNTLLLAGEEGIGKSRLAAEALVLARQRGFLTLSGTAYALHTDLAYAPVLEAIGPFLAGLPASQLSQLLRGLTDLSRLFGNLSLAPPAPLGDPALERTRLFEAVARLVERMAADRPLAILIDDLHWADSASLDLLHYVARGLADQRVLLLGAYRLDEARAQPRLRLLLRSLQRLGLGEEVTLTPLPSDEVAKLAAAVLAGEPPEALLSFLQDRAAGTPLYVTALIRGLRDRGELFRSSGGVWDLGASSLSTVPPVVHDLVLGRLERLDASERTLVELMAVAGDAASDAVLRQVGGIPPEELDAVVRRVADVGLLVEESASNDVFYRAAHPLISEVAYAELSDSRRRRLHAEVAAALEGVGVEDPQRLAHHYRGAAWEVDANRALQVLMAAATAAEHMHADAEASGYLAAALDLARIDHPDMIGELLERLGSARMRAGHIELAVAAWTEASRERQRAADWSALTHLRGLLATAEWERGRFQEAEEHLSAALAMARHRAADAELVELHQIQLQLRARQADAAGLEEVLAALAEAGGTPELMAATNLIRGYAAFLQGRFGDARDLVLVAAETAEKTGLIPMAARAQRQLATIAANAGDTKLCRDHLAADLALVARAGSPMLEVGARAMIMATDLISDAWEESLTASRGLMVLSKRIGSPRGLATSLAVEGIVHAYRGEIVAARRSVAEARQVYGNAAAVDRHIFIFVEISEAITALAGGDPEQARRFAAAAVAAPDVLPVVAFMVMGEAEVAANDPEAALLTARHLRDLGPKAPWPAACASWVDGLARAALGQRSSALACLRDAADRLEGLGFPYQEAKARLRWAEAAVGGSGNDGDASQARSEPAAEARRALINFDRLGARPLADRARRVLRDLGERHRPPRRLVTGDLSDRELQVVRLVADGLSNNEIAARLYISPRTVTTHLQHVYQRLGLASRTALIRWALDRGLASGNT